MSKCRLQPNASLFSLFAAKESERQGSGQVEPEHLLLGLLREEQCLGARILQAHEVTFSRVLEEVTRARRGGEAKAFGTLRTKEEWWCCADFRARCYQLGRKEDRLGILFLTQSRVGTFFRLEYRRPDRTPSEPIAADGIKLKFCPWCGCNLSEWYGSGFPLFPPATSK
jgi:Clp amino terminal domain, pathogenicity island component